MTKPIHHATVKRASKLGVALIVLETGVALSHGAKLSNEEWATPKEALDAFEAGSVTWKRVETGKCGVMVASYHDRYEHNPHGPGCGDGLDVAMRDAFTTPGGVNVEALRECGMTLALWHPAWDPLNPGMKRMNLTNRMRAWLRNNEGTISIGGTIGRFGVAFSPAGRIAKKLAKLAQAA